MAVAMLEGFDIQAMGVAAPRLAPEFGLGPGEMKWIFAVSNIGMVLGAALGGWLADRVGRKPVFMTSVAMFGVFTLCVIFTGEFGTLFATRLFAGLGFGAALPNMMAIAAERHGQDGRAAKPRMTRQAVVAAAAERHRRGGGQRADERIVHVRQRRCIFLEIVGGHANAGNAHEHAGIPIDRQANRTAHSRMARQPLEARLRAARQIFVMQEEVLEQLEPRGRAGQGYGRTRGTPHRKRAERIPGQWIPAPLRSADQRDRRRVPAGLGVRGVIDVLPSSWARSAAFSAAISS